MMEPTLPDELLSLPDELLLLALRDDEGSVVPAAVPVLNGALAGAILMELALRDRVEEAEDYRLNADPIPTGDPLLDDVCQRIAEEDRQHDAHTWVARLSTELPNLKDRLLERLVAAGVLEQRDGRVLWVFPTQSFPLAAGGVERQARERIRAVVLAEETPDPRTAALISLVQAANLLDELFSPDERPRARHYIAKLIKASRTEKGAFQRGVAAAALFGIVGGTLYYGYRRLLREPFWSSGWLRSTDFRWDADLLDPWAALWADSVSGDDRHSSTWEDRSAVAASMSSNASDAGSSGSTWSPDPGVDGSGSAEGVSSESGSSSGGWFSWWGSWSDSGSSNNDNSGGSWWDSFSSDSGGWWGGGSSDSGGSWGSGGGDSGSGGGGDSGGSSSG